VALATAGSALAVLEELEAGLAGFTMGGLSALARLTVGRTGVASVGVDVEILASRAAGVGHGVGV
jgi:hypothetical protein